MKYSRYEVKFLQVKVKTTEIEKILPSGENLDEYDEEISEMKDEGFGVLVIASEKWVETILRMNQKLRQAINWWLVATITGAAVLQIFGGAAALIFSVGVGATFGMAMLQVRN